MNVKAGTVADFASSMAAAMENALEEEYRSLKGGSLPGLGRDDRRMLFCAIAQGVVRHLKDNLDAFAISVEARASSEPGVSRGEGTIDELHTRGTLY